MSNDDFDRETPPDHPFEDVDRYLKFTSRLPDEANARVRRYVDPLTGERRSFQYDNLMVLAEIHHVRDLLGYVPTSDDFEEYGYISLAIYRDRFGTFPRAVEVAGLEPEFKSAQEKARYHAKYEELVDPEDHHPFKD